MARILRLSRCAHCDARLEIRRPMALRLHPTRTELYPSPKLYLSPESLRESYLESGGRGTFLSRSPASIALSLARWSQTHYLDPLDRSGPEHRVPGIAV